MILIFVMENTAVPAPGFGLPVLAFNTRRLDTLRPKAESRKPKAESRKPKAESRKPEAGSRKPEPTP